jgi:hypothetical protein
MVMNSSCTDYCYHDLTAEEDSESDVCSHGKGFDEICVDCCPEDDDGSFTGDEWS